MNTNGDGNGRWTKTTLDGLGRTIKVETGYAAITKSIAETEYDSCACSPTGKLKRSTMPYAPGGTKWWKTNTYDALGRTVSLQEADHASKVTDPARASRRVLLEQRVRRDSGWAGGRPPEEWAEVCCGWKNVPVLLLSAVRSYRYPHV